MKSTIAVRGPEGAVALWEPTTLRQLGKDEAYLEAALSATPQLLCLESKRTGIYGPFAVFNQVELETPQGRTIYPDIVLLAASGDVVIVEVKLFDNPELRKRDVIAQAIDYASSVSALDEAGTARLFDGGKDADWSALVRSHFPDEDDPDELAVTLRHNAKEANVHIVIACDKAPGGVYEQARSVSAQSHLGFSLDVVEVTPFVPESGAGDAIMFVPNVRFATEIVARTAVSVSYEAGSPQPGVSIETTSVEEIEENLATVAQGGTRQSRARTWTDEEIEDAMLASDNPAVHELFLFAKNEGHGGRIQSDSPKVSATFGFYMNVRKPNGSVGPMMFFNYVDGARRLVVYTNWQPATVPEDILEEYKGDLRTLFGPVIDNPEPNVPLAAVGENLEAFQEAVRKLRDRIVPSATG